MTQLCRRNESFLDSHCPGFALPSLFLQKVPLLRPPEAAPWACIFLPLPHSVARWFTFCPEAVPTSDALSKHLVYFVAVKRQSRALLTLYLRWGIRAEVTAEQPQASVLASRNRGAHKGPLPTKADSVCSALDSWIPRSSGRPLIPWRESVLWFFLSHNRELELTKIMCLSKKWRLTLLSPVHWLQKLPCPIKDYPSSWKLYVVLMYSEYPKLNSFLQGHFLLCCLSFLTFCQQPSLSLMCVWGGGGAKRTTSVSFMSQPHFCFLRQGFSLAWNLPSRPNWSVNPKDQPLPSAGMTRAHLHTHYRDDKGTLLYPAS